MEQRVSLITLAVRNLPRSRDFYENGLGWRPAFSSDEVAFYQIGGVVLSLFSLADYLQDAQLAPESIKTGSVALAHNVRNREEVDAVLDQAVQAGARILRTARPTPWGGYSGYFADPDGQPWEVAFNPAWPLEEDGSLKLPDPG
ncbi:MAG: VOC family protein [Candidatus Korobacteraceae bacterium]